MTLAVAAPAGTWTGTSETVLKIDRLTILPDWLLLPEISDYIYVPTASKRDRKEEQRSSEVKGRGPTWTPTKPKWITLYSDR